MKKKHNNCGCFTLILLCVIAVIVVSAITKDNSPQAKARFEQSQRREQAYYTARKYIQDKLHAPSTAKWSIPRRDEGAWQIKGKPGRYEASGTVEASNLFGVPLKQTWEVGLIDRGSEWNIYYARLGDQIYVSVDPDEYEQNIEKLKAIVSSGTE